MGKENFTHTANYFPSAKRVGKMTSQSLSGALLLCAAMLIAGAASAQVSQTRCYTSYVRGQHRSTCVSINTPSPRPPRQEPTRPGHGGREDVVTKPVKSQQQPAAAPKPDGNFCGAGYKMTADGCAPAGGGR